MSQEEETRLAALQWTPQCSSPSTCTQKQMAALLQGQHLWLWKHLTRPRKQIKTEHNHLVWPFYNQVTFREPSVCGGHFDVFYVPPLASLFTISFSHDLLCQRQDAAARFRQLRDKRGRGRGRGPWGFWSWWLNAALNFTLSQFLTTGTGNEGMRGTEAWSRNKSIGGVNPCQLEEKTFLSLFLLQQCPHWEPSWLDTIFSFCRLMIAAQCQQRLTLNSFTIDFIRMLMCYYGKKVTFIHCVLFLKH